MRLDKQITEIVESVRMHENARTTYRNIQSDSCKDFYIPSRYARIFGLEKTSLLSGLLEGYHQMRLKDEL